MSKSYLQPIEFPNGCWENVKIFREGGSHNIHISSLFKTVL